MPRSQDISRDAVISVARRVARAGAAVCFLMAPAVPARAHHSFSAEFSADKIVSLTGTVSRLEWVNPHVWIYIEVRGADGVRTRWGVECGAPSAMLRRGAGRDSLPVGAQVTIDGYQSKSGQPIAKGRSIKWSDGRKAHIGSPGSGAPDDLPIAR